VDGLSPASVDRGISGASSFPIARRSKRVGTYSGRVKSGAGYFYDDVAGISRLVCIPNEGPGRWPETVTISRHSQSTNARRHLPGRRKVLKNRCPHPPAGMDRRAQPGQYTVEKTERIAEWRVEWLKGAKRGPNSIREFLAHPRPAREGMSRALMTLYFFDGEGSFPRAPASDGPRNSRILFGPRLAPFSHSTLHSAMRSVFSTVYCPGLGSSIHSRWRMRTSGSSEPCADPANAAARSYSANAAK